MEELRKTQDLVKKEKTTLFEGAYTCPACGYKKIEVRTIFSSNRIVKQFHCNGCGHDWNNLDDTDTEQLS